MPPSPAPLVSVVIATYNRAALVVHAVESVRRSTITDLEILVIGDACTDDTAARLAAMDDPRVTFVNLAVNAGEQSAPNNEGLRLARGRYIAFLNHDDLYLPDHLATAVAHLEREAADFVWSPLLVALPPADAGDAAVAPTFRLSGVTFGDDYDPRVFVFASAWLCTQALAARVGPWRPARALFVTPSQDWLFRAWRSGARVRFQPLATVVAVPLSVRHGSYVATATPEHDRLVAAMQTPGFRDRALASAAVNGERDVNRYRFGQAWLDNLRALAFRPVSALALACGRHPYAPFAALRHGRRGNLVSAIRRQGGLAPLERRNPSPPKG